ncbi:hypothetical protein CRG98_006258 [Punica granatum]|uniref:Uncharacterized protein n=1 Tax=Punica granatum TaxID=22663 RepID=A0A2I0KYB7_PUNGR|nr:hypothetical protein CRG98_006258 [Punica granatum]
MKVCICPMDELPCYVDRSLIQNDNEWEDFGEASSESGSLNELVADGAVHTSPADELVEPSEANGRQQLTEAPLVGAQSGSQSCSANSPMRASSPIMPNLSCLEDTQNGRSMFASIQEFGVKLDQPPGNQATMLDKVQGPTSSNPVASKEVEIIELITPPPDPRSRRLQGKRRRVSTVCPEIIDLTNSPVFVQL